MDDLMEVWVETFHSFSTLLVIWDVSRHYEILKECGVLVRDIEAYNSKVVTVELPGVLEAFELIDSIQEAGLGPVMQVYHNGKLVSDNIEP